MGHPPIGGSGRNLDDHPLTQGHGKGVFGTNAKAQESSEGGRILVAA